MIKKKLYSRVFFLVVLIGAAAPVFGETARDYFLEAERRFSQGDYYGATDLYKEALRLNPSYFEANFSLAKIYFILEEYDKSLEYIENAERLSRNRTEVMVQKGRILIGLEQLKNAQEIFQKALEQEPLNLEAQLGLAEIALLGGQFGQAEAMFQQSLYQLPESRRALLSLVILYDNRLEFSTAQKYLDSALRIHALNPQVHRVAVLHYLKAGHPYQALYHAQELYSLRSDSMDSVLLLGRVQLELGQYEEAEKQLEDALRIDRTNPRIWYLLSRIYFALNDTDKAYRALDKVLELDIQDEISRIVLENELVQRNSENISLRDELAKNHFRRGWEQEELYHFERALSEYRRGIYVSPSQYRGWLAYSRILLRTGYPHRALDKLYAVRNDEYEDGEIDEEIERLERTLSTGVAGEWGIDQFSLRRQPSTISLFSVSGQSSLSHFESEQHLLEYLRYHLIEDVRLDVGHINPGLTSYSEAYQMGRSHQSDYFAITSFFETERTFGIRCGLYLSRTGSLIKEFSQIRTGNGRVNDAVLTIAKRISEEIPVRGELIAKNQNEGILNLGRFQGIETGQKFDIVKSREIRLTEVFPFIDYDREDILGQFEVTELDEEIASGKITYSSPFDLVNSGDSLIYLPEGDESAENDIQEESFPVIDEELREQLLKIY